MLRVKVPTMNDCIVHGVLRHERLPKKTKVTTEGLPKRRSASVIKVHGQMRSNTFKKG